MLPSKISHVAEIYGYQLTQINGQRIFGPPKNWIGPPPAKGCEVFVGRLPREVYEDVIFPVFSRIGKVYTMRLMMDFSGSNRGYAFVKYTTREDANAAVRQLAQYPIIPGHAIGVKKSVDNCRLVISGIPTTKVKSEVMVELDKYVDGIESVTLYKDCMDRRLNRGFVIVRFLSHNDAAKARRALVPGHMQLWGNEVDVDWAEAELDHEDDQFMHANILCIKYLYIHTTKATIQAIIETAIGARIAAVEKMNDCCYVNFYKSKHAKQALIFLRNAQIDGVSVSVTLEPRFRSRNPINNENQCSYESLTNQYQSPSTVSDNFPIQTSLNIPIMKRNDSYQSSYFKYDHHYRFPTQNQEFAPSTMRSCNFKSFDSLFESPTDIHLKDVESHPNTFIANDMLASTSPYSERQKTSSGSSSDQSPFYSMSPIRSSPDSIQYQFVSPPLTLDKQLVYKFDDLSLSQKNYF